jgi:hypothetical protein
VSEHHGERGVVKHQAPGEDRVEGAEPDGDHGERDTDGIAGCAGLVHDEQRPRHRDGDRDRERGRNAFAKDQCGQQQDGDRLQGPEQDRHAGSDGRQPEQTERVGDTGVEDPEGGESAQ